MRRSIRQSTMYLQIDLFLIFSGERPSLWMTPQLFEFMAEREIDGLGLNPEYDFLLDGEFTPIWPLSPDLARHTTLTEDTFLVFIKRKQAHVALYLHTTQCTELSREYDERGLNMPTCLVNNCWIMTDYMHHMGTHCQNEPCNSKYQSVNEIT